MIVTKNKVLLLNTKVEASRDSRRNITIQYEEYKILYKKDCGRRVTYLFTKGVPVCIDKKTGYYLVKKYPEIVLCDKNLNIVKMEDDLTNAKIGTLRKIAAQEDVSTGGTKDEIQHNIRIKRKEK